MANVVVSGFIDDSLNGVYVKQAYLTNNQIIGSHPETAQMSLARLILRGADLIVVVYYIF